MVRKAVWTWNVVALAGLAASTSAQSQSEDVPSEGFAPFLFKHVSAERGLTDVNLEDGMAWGVSAADYDDDGDVDLYAAQGGRGPDRVYRNDGSGSFVDVAPQLGLDSIVRNRAGLWIDYDGDHDLDLFTTNDHALAASSFGLFEQVSTVQFDDVTSAAGLSFVALEEAVTHRGGVCAGDVDLDGYLDVFVASWHGQQRLFHNTTTGGFTDISIASGVGVRDDGWQPVMVDANGDGYLDIYQAIDFTPNRLWINNRDLTFDDFADVAGCDIVMNDMGASVLDYDNDGKLDLYTTNIYGVENGVPEYNCLMRNTGSFGLVSYADESLSAGVVDGGWGWGTTSIDADRDGLIEIVATNGWSKRRDSTRLWKRDSRDDLQFTEMAAESGVRDFHWGSCLIAFDADRDGDQDLLQLTRGGKLRLLDAQPNPKGGELGNYLVVRPRMTGTNQRAIGSVVTLISDGLTQTRQISAGTSIMGQEPAEAFFGVGSQSSVDLVRVTFPGGALVEMTDVAVGQVLTITAP